MAMSPRTRILSLLFVSLAAGLPAAADDTTVQLYYDHLNTNTSVTIPTALRPGQKFRVTIQNTCPGQFVYDMHGLPTQVRSQATKKALVPSRLEDKPLDGVYDSRYGSYLIDIHSKEGGTPCVTTAGKPADLRQVQIVMAVTPIEWEIGQDAALTLAPRAIRKWTTQPVSVTSTTAGSAGQTTVTQYKVVRDSDHEDPVRANFATLTHLYAPTWNQGLALGFGLVDNSAEYLLRLELGPRTPRKSRRQSRSRRRLHAGDDAPERHPGERPARQSRQAEGLHQRPRVSPVRRSDRDVLQERNQHEASGPGAVSRAAAVRARHLQLPYASLSVGSR